MYATVAEAAVVPKIVAILLNLAILFFDLSHVYIQYSTALRQITLILVKNVVYKYENSY